MTYRLLDISRHPNRKSNLTEFKYFCSQCHRDNHLIVGVISYLSGNKVSHYYCMYCHGMYDYVISPYIHS